jgi:hypothetical protein
MTILGKSIIIITIIIIIYTNADASDKNYEILP